MIQEPTVAHDPTAKSPAEVQPPRFNGTRDVVSLRGFVSPEFSVGTHRIVWIKSGNGQYVFGDQTQPVEEDDVLMMSPGCRSIFFPEDQQVHLRVIAFDAPDGFMSHSHRVFADRDRRHRLLTEIIDDLRECPDERRDTLLGVALQLFDEVEAESLVHEDPKLQEVVRHIDANPHQSLGVTELAQMCGYSESHFRRLFREVMGTTPKQYIKKTKMEYALYLLREEKLPVKEVAATLGYNDTFEFSKQFKTVYGLSPSKKARSAD